MNKSKITNRYFKDDTLIVYLMMFPMLIGFVLFTIYPIFYVIKYAMFQYDGIHVAKFTGLYNFIRAITNDTTYWESLVNSLVLTFGKLIFEVPIALLIAVLLNSKSKLNSLFRTAYFMPTIISSAIVGIVFSILFGGYNGIVNNILIQSGLLDTGLDWFKYKWSSMSVIMIASVWANFGITMVFFLMGLQSIPKDMYECSEIDGANKLQQFFKITVPMLAPILQIIIMLAIVEGMKLTELVLVLTNGMPGGKTEVVMTYIFKYFFNIDSFTTGATQYGYASALSVITALVIGIITVLYLNLSKNMKKIY